MPAKSPYQAVERFLQPIRIALGCVSKAHVTTSKGGKSPQVETPHSWSINDADGAALKVRSGSGLKGLRLDATMHWKLIEDPRPGYGPLRVTTTGYLYSLITEDTKELWMIHWHPRGNSDEREPHFHLGDLMLAAGAPITSSDHIPTSRMTFENVIRWAILFGAQPLSDDYEQRLSRVEHPHVRHRTWAERKHWEVTPLGGSSGQTPPTSRGVAR